MPTFTGKTFANFYKNILGINQTSNTGVDATTRTVHDGAGNSSALSLSDDVVSIQPVNDDTTGAMLVKNNAGNNILAVDTDNGKVLVNASQKSVNTNYAYFSVSSTFGLGAVAGTHYAVPFGGGMFTATNVTLGTGTNPSTSYDVSANDNADDLTMMLWFIPDNITVDQVYWFSGGSGASGDTINIHLLAFDIDKGVGAGKGDLSNGVVVAGGADKGSLGYGNIIYETIAPASADVDAGSVCIATFESSGTSSDYAVNIICKYHLR